MTQTHQNELFIDSLNLDFGTILEKIILGGIIFILALPLVGDYGLTLFPIGRDVIFKLTVEFLVILSLLFWTLKNWGLIENCKLKIENFSPITLSLLVFWIIMALATLFSTQQSFSIWGNIYKNQGFITWSHYIFLFLLLITFVKEKKHWQLLINTAILIGVVIGLISLWQMLRDGITSMPSATLNNSNYLAAYLVLLIPVTLAFFLKNKSYFLGTALALQSIALIATQTRGAYLGLLCSLFIFAFLYFKNKRVVIFAPILLIALYILIILTPARQYIQEKIPSSVRFLNIESIYNTGGPRLEAWQAGWHAMLNKPILGYGPENFFVAFDEFYSGSQDHNGSLAIEGSLWESWFDKAHNFIFDIGVTTGFLGLFAYIAIFSSAIWMLFRRLSVVSGQWSVVYAGLIASFVGYLVQNLFGFDTTVPGIYLVFLLGYANFIHNSPLHPPLTLSGENSAQSLVVGSPSLSVRERTGGVSYRKQARRIFFFCSILLLSSLFITSLKLHIDILSANRQLNLAEVLSKSGRLDESFAAYEKGLKYNASPINPNLRRRYAVIALAYYNAIEERCGSNVTGSDPVTLSLEQCEEFSKDSKKYLSRALELQQKNAAGEWQRFTRNYIYAAQISHILGDYENSDKFFEKALELSPNRTSINTEWARLREERGNLINTN